MPRPKKEPKNHGRVYEVKVVIGKTASGELVRKSFYSSISKKDAMEKAEKYKISQVVAEVTDEPLATNDVTFAVMANKLLEVVKPKVRGNTYAFTYKNMINNHLIPYFGKAKIKDIKNIDIATFLNKQGKKYSLETLKKDLLCLRQIFDLAIQNDIIKKNPCYKIKLSSDIPKIKKQTYTQEQIDYILEYAKTHKYGLEIILLAEYGLRRGELLGIKWEDIDFENNILHIRRGVACSIDKENNNFEIAVGDPKNDFSKRDIPISEEIKNMLLARPKSIWVGRNVHKKIQGEEIFPEFVFCDKKGNVMNPDNWTKRHYAKFMQNMQDFYAEKNIEIPILHPHELRHTRASLWVNAGKNLFAVASVLGHADLSMLRKRYAHPEVESIRQLLQDEPEEKK